MKRNKKDEVKIKLKKSEETELKKIVRKGSTKARVITRARVLLLSNLGKRPALISESLEVTKKTVQNIKERFIEGGIKNALYDKKRPGAPTKFEGKHRAQITALACSDAPEGYAKWSLNLLVDKAVELGIVDDISRSHLDRILKKTK